MTIPTFKLVITGQPGVGKHTLCHQFLESQIGVQSMVEFMGDEANIDKAHSFPLTLNTNMGALKFNCCVFSEEETKEENQQGGTTTNQQQQQQLSVPDKFYVGANCAILMFDVTSRISYREVPNYFRDLVRVADSIPICLVGNKCDCADRTVKPKHIMFHRKKNLQYYDVSAKAHYNIMKPFLWLAKRLVNSPQLELVAEPSRCDPDVSASNQVKTALDDMEKDLTMAANAPIPDDDDDDL